jgi:AcrR family transcriptional regulator
MTDRPGRRTSGARAGGRSAFVVERVLEAAAEELGRVGFAEMRIEDVAARSRVNKTTIYRRWPGKPELLAAVLDKEHSALSVPDTGSLQGDLSAALRDLRARLYTARERGIIRMLQAERAQPDVAALIARMRAENNAIRRVPFERAIARGELSASVDTDLLVEFTHAPLVSRIVHLGLEVDDAFIDALSAFACAGSHELQLPAAVPAPSVLELG